ncbi:MAG: hypothetical protein U1E17_13445 [Geminicoccaceae bacterium]
MSAEEVAMIVVGITGVVARKWRIMQGAASAWKGMAVGAHGADRIGQRVVAGKLAARQLTRRSIEAGRRRSAKALAAGEA